jgi:ferric-dicitrate binding protein FerR (iron transport regulator)
MISPVKPNGEIAQQAYFWVEKELRDESMEGFDEWSTSSPEHLGAYLRMTAISRLLPQSRVLQKMDVNAVAPTPWLDLRDRFAHFFAKATRRVVTVGVLFAMVLVGLSASGLLDLVHHRLADSGRPEKTGITDKAGQWTPISAARSARDVSLDDGSRLRMASGSQLRVRMTTAERVVQLQAGGVVFTVQNDSKRPFFVDVPSARITTLGTVFEVQRLGDDTRVSVQEGSVQVMSRSPDATPLVARSGDAVVIRPQGLEIEGPTAAVPARRPSPATGATVTRKLSEIAAAFNSANSTPQFVVEGAARDERLWVDVATTEPEKLIAVLESEPGFEVSREDGRVVIRLK